MQETESLFSSHFLLKVFLHEFHAAFAFLIRFVDWRRSALSQLAQALSFLMVHFLHYSRRETACHRRDSGACPLRRIIDLLVALGLISFTFQRYF